MSEFEVGSHVLLNLQSEEFCKGMSKHTWQIVGISRSGFHVKSINNPDFNGLIVDKSALVPLTEINQQSEIDQLEVQLSLQRDRNKALEAELTSSRNYGDQLKAEKAGLLRLAEQWREQAKELCRVDDKYVIGSLLSCAERLEEAVRGEHE